MNAPHGNGILDDKVMLVAGVGPAMGAATALVATREGAKVALLARRTEISGETADAIRADGGSALALQCDLGDGSTVRAAVDTVVAEWGHVDAVFYNAAYYDHKNTSLDVDEATWQQAMDVNFGGAMTLTARSCP